MPRISRRKFVQTTLALPMVAAAASGKRNIIVTGGHPGDPEYGCAGTIARLTDAGDNVTLLYLNRGEKGCTGKSANDCADLRSAEAEAACRILNAHAVFANQTDGEAVVDRASYEAFRKLLEAQKPDAVFTHWPVDGHPDHRAISSLTYDAWLRLGRKFALYYYEVSTGEDTLMFSPTDYVDITNTESRKRAACYAHASQTPDRYYALQSEVAHFRGVESGFKSAEAFVHHVESQRIALP